MGHFSEMLFQHLQCQLKDQTDVEQLFACERRLDLFCSNYSAISDHYDQIDTSEGLLLLTKESFLDLTLQVCRHLTQSRPENVSFNGAETKLGLACSKCIIKSESDQRFEQLIDTLIRESNVTFLVRSFLIDLNILQRTVLIRCSSSFCFDPGQSFSC
jgi:hypothetical protein